MIHLSQVLYKALNTGAKSLEVIIQKRQVDEREGRLVGLVDMLSTVSNPLTGYSIRRWSPESKKRERPQLCVEFIAKGGRLGIDVWDLSAIGWVHGAGGDGIVG